MQAMIVVRERFAVLRRGAHSADESPLAITSTAHPRAAARAAVVRVEGADVVLGEVEVVLVENADGRHEIIRHAGWMASTGSIGGSASGGRRRPQAH
jgi:hypothetical protein